MQQKKTILIVEDDNLLRKILVERFSKEFTVVEAEDGVQAVERAVAYKPDLILLDLLLARLDGFKVLETVRKHPDKAVAEIRAVVLSGLHSNEDILEAERLGISAYLIKAHTDLDSVERKVKETLGMIL